MEDAKRRIEPPAVIRHLMAEKPASEGMFRVALEARDAAVLDRDQDASRVGAVKGTGRFENRAAAFAHGFFFLGALSVDSNTKPLDD